jgi:predicted phage terminase large subunit-like protein
VARAAASRKRAFIGWSTTIRLSQTTPTSNQKLRSKNMPKKLAEWSPADVALAAELAAYEARECFWAFRRYIRPNILWGWCVEKVAIELHMFRQDMAAGKRPTLALMMPPQHGKTTAVEDFIAWLGGLRPDWKVIYSSYSDELGVQRNLNLQRTIQSPRYHGLFNTRIGAPGFQKNSGEIDYVGHTGSFINTTVGGSITGLGLNLGVVDDPVKGRAEATSKTIRDRIWAWFVDDFMTRFADLSGLIIIMTRWHVDDLLGRYLKMNPNVRIVRFPAIAENDEPHRRAGEALFPELKPLDFLLERKKMMSKASWESEYQQNPITPGGGIFPIEKLGILLLFDRRQVSATVRAWDKAGTAGGDGAYTAGVLMHKMLDGTFVLENVTRGRWSALERERIIKQLAERDQQVLHSCGKWDYRITKEQEPGSGGKESAEATIRNLAGFIVIADKVTGSKELRADPFAAQVQGGNVWLVDGPWVTDFREEAEAYPNSRYLDQIDAAAMAFHHLTTSGGPPLELYERVNA